MILLLVIFLEGLYAYFVMSRNSEHLQEIITRHEGMLQRWYDVTEIIEEAKDRFNEYRLGRIDVIAPVDLLIIRVIKEVREIKDLTTDEHTMVGIEEILKNASFFKDAALGYGAEVRVKGRAEESVRQHGDYAVAVSERMTILVRDGASYVRQRIKSEHLSILNFSSFSQNMLGVVLVLAAILTAAVSAWLARTLAAPVRVLVEGTKRLAAGELSCRVAIDSNDEIGELARSFNAMAEDLTRSRNELLAAKRFTDNIIASMINTLVVVDRVGMIRMVNQATCNLLGYREEELLNEPVARIFAGGYFDELEFEGLAEKGQAGNLETVYQTKDGKKLSVLLSWAVVYGERHNSSGFVFVAQDITMQAEALRAGHLASLGELAAGVAHEINNPINSIINFAQLQIDEIEQGESPSVDMLQRIIKEGDRISSIVRSLLSFAREGDKSKKMVQVQEILHETLALTELQIRKDGIHLENCLSPGLPAIAGHFQQIQQVFLNIINNARYALNRRYDGPHPDKIIAITGKTMVDEDGSWLEITFLDRGVGIPAAIIDKVKNPFFSTKPAGLGTGLGLTISHGIVTDHDGLLTIESQEGEYTKISVRLPALDAGIALGSSYVADPRAFFSSG